MNRQIALTPTNGRLPGPPPPRVSKESAPPSGPAPPPPPLSRSRPHPQPRPQPGSAPSPEPPPAAAPAPAPEAAAAAPAASAGPQAAPPIPSNQAHPTLSDGRQSPLVDERGNLKPDADVPEDVRRHNEEFRHRYDRAYNQIAEDGKVQKGWWSQDRHFEPGGEAQARERERGTVH